MLWKLGDVECFFFGCSFENLYCYAKRLFLVCDVLLKSLSELL